MKSPTKHSYERALEIIKQYEDRQKVLANLGKDLSYKLQQFDQVKFKVNKKVEEVLFTGVHKESGKLLLGKSVCRIEDEFELVIGKLIAVKKALNENIEEVVKHVENGIILSSGNGLRTPLVMSTNGAKVIGTLSGTPCVVDAVQRISYSNALI